MSLTISLTVSVITGAILLLVLDLSNTGNFLIIIAAGLSVFIITHIATTFLLNRFVTEKINPLYKTIYNLNINERHNPLDLIDKDIITEVKRDVLEWADTKAREIDRLKEMEKYRKEFLGNVSHELKTPIFNIQGYILTLLDGGLDDPSINRKYLERAEKSVNRMISIVEDLETITRLEAGEIKLSLERFNIVQLVEEVFEAQEERANKRDIRLKFDQLYEKPIWVNADKKRIFQVVNNLIINSIYYGTPQGRTIVSFTDTPDRVMVEVNDNGIGIDKKDIPRIFERFYRVDKSRSREQGGTGLGLAIVKHIIEGHGQSIHVTSNLNEGTSFVFTLEKSKKK
jgi:two-component system phosphate regulon sensor histidine kinase PhoR